MKRDRVKHTYSVPPTAECEAPGCGWLDLSRGALGRAAQHHDRTGHTVRVETTRVIRYGATELVPSAESEDTMTLC